MGLEQPLPLSSIHWAIALRTERPLIFYVRVWCALIGSRSVWQLLWTPRSDLCSGQVRMRVRVKNHVFVFASQLANLVLCKTHFRQIVIWLSYPPSSSLLLPSSSLLILTSSHSEHVIFSTEAEASIQELPSYHYQRHCSREVKTALVPTPSSTAN